MEKSLGFIGGGRITRIILQALKNKELSLRHISVAEIDADVANQLRIDFPEISITEPGIAAAKKLVFVALHPPVIMETLEKIKPSVSSETIVISLAPKITIDKIAAKLVKTNKIIRLIPNATSYINEGYNPVTFSPVIAMEEKVRVLELLKSMGNTFEVDERKLEAYAVVSAMAPTYFWFQWESLALIGEQLGLEKGESTDTVYHTLKAALDTQFKSGLSHEAVKDLIPVKPICDHEAEITKIFNEKLIGLHQKIKP
jgi:pyrroline-5-carboxylate reductase